MPSANKDILFNKIHRFFKEKGIHIDKLDMEEFIAYLYQESLNQGRIKESGKLRLTPRYVISTLSSYLKEKMSTVTNLLRKPREKRPHTSYDCLLPDQAVFNSHKDIISTLGLKKKHKHKVTKPDGSALSPETQAKIHDGLPNCDLSFSPVEKIPEEKIRPRALASDKTIYEENLCTAKLAWLKQNTPCKNSPYRVKVSDELAEDFEGVRSNLVNTFDYEANKNKVKTFSFEVTKERVLSRLNTKRSTSQKAVMDNVTAKELFEAAGAEFYEDETGRDFHHCHEVGHSLGGDQSKPNLDPMTRGANYQLLFVAEAPVKKLLMDETVKKFKLMGTVTFDEQSGLTKKAVYYLTWGNEADYIRVIIDAMNRKRPSVEDNEIAEFLFNLSVQPVSPLPKRSKVYPNEDLPTVSLR